ncbi:sugar ABC transporter ATP-binding protein [Gordonia sp. NPDC003376]
MSKTFVTTTVLHSVDADFPAGSITAVLGENGAGKSTLFKILAGFHEPDSGAELFVDGQAHPLPLTVTSSAHLGFAFVHQDLGLADSLTVSENVCVGSFVTRAGVVLWRKQHDLVRTLMADLGMDIAPTAAVSTLTRAEKATVAIARAVYARGRRSSALLVLDEPTANLTERERDIVFTVMRNAAAMGTAVVFCTHRLDEVLAVTDGVIILRDGRVVARHTTADINGEAELVREILGREVDEFVERRASSTDRASTVLSVRGLSGHGVNDIHFDVRRGEIFGLTGLAGAGQDTVGPLLMGAQTRSAGRQSVNGIELRTVDPHHAVGLGLAFLPADRKRSSGVQAATIRENFSMVTLADFTRGWLVNRKSERESTLSAIAEFDIRPAGDSERPLGSLSGGNQQKVLLAKWLTRKKLCCLILHEPTQGIDVGAKAMVLAMLSDLAARGIAIVLISSEHEELSHLCDRVAVMRQGTIAAELERPTAHQIAQQCYASRGAA